MTIRYLAPRWGIEPREVQSEYVPRTEAQEARRSMRDWLRDRNDDDADDWAPPDLLES